MRITIELGTHVGSKGAMVKLVLVKGTRSRWSTGIHVDPAGWDRKRARVKVHVPFALSTNARITEHLERAEQLAAKDPALSPAALRDILSRPDPEGKTVVELARLYMSSNAHRFGMVVQRTRETAIRNLEAVAPNATPKDMRREDVLSLDRMLSTSGLAPNTVRSRMRMVRTMYRAACKMSGIGIRDIFEGIIRKEEATTVKHLAPEEVERVKALDLSGHLAVARDAWIFAMSCGGVRFGDLCRLVPGDVQDGALVYTQHKAKKPKWIPLSPLALSIAERYKGGRTLLPLATANTEEAIASANSMVNDRLKVVARMAGVRPMTTHMARHTWTNLAAATGASLRSIQLILGHSSLSTTEVYLAKFDRDSVAEVFKKMG